MSDVQNNLDDEARAELLCYLVVSQLVAHTLSNRWLTVDNLVESTQVWLNANGGRADLAARMSLVRAAQELTPTLPVLPFPGTQPEIMKLFADRWQLDYRTPLVRAIFDLCQHFLARGL